MIFIWLGTEQDITIGKKITFGESHYNCDDDLRYWALSGHSFQLNIYHIWLVYDKICSQEMGPIMTHITTRSELYVLLTMDIVLGPTVHIIEKVTCSLEEKEIQTWTDNLCDSQFADPMKQFLIGSNSQNCVRSWKCAHNWATIGVTPLDIYVAPTNVSCTNRLYIRIYVHQDYLHSKTARFKFNFLLLHSTYSLACGWRFQTFFTTHYLDWLRIKINTSSNLVWNLQENYTL